MSILLVLVFQRASFTKERINSCNDNKFGSSVVRVAATSGNEILRTTFHAPQANATCERFLRSVRHHTLIFHERQLERVLNAYVAYFNQHDCI